jgi:hypothetical protein
MNRYLTFSLAISMTLGTLAIPLRAANQPRAGKPERTKVVWTNEDLERLRGLGLISVVGQDPEEAPADDAQAEDPAPSPYVETQDPRYIGTQDPQYVETQDPEWYAEQASQLRAELERREGRLQSYLQAIEDARALKPVTGGVNLARGDIAITLEDGIEILQWRVYETQSDLDDLEDLARRNDIPPGVLRGQ